MSSKSYFQYEITKNRDMKGLYKRVLDTFEDFPLFILMEELEDGSDLLVHRLEKGDPLFYIKDNSDDAVINMISGSIKKDDYNEYPAFEFENNDFDAYGIRKWIQCVCCIADILDVECPQVLFVHGEDAGAAAGQILVIPDALPDLDTLISISHELRHVWQHKHHPEWSDDYVHPEDSIEEYYYQKAELDAEAFARRFVGGILKLDIIDVRDKLFFADDPMLSDKLFNTAMSISMVEFFSKKEEMEFLRSIMK